MKTTAADCDQIWSHKSLLSKHFVQRVSISIAESGRNQRSVTNIISTTDMLFVCNKGWNAWSLWQKGSFVISLLVKYQCLQSGLLILEVRGKNIQAPAPKLKNRFMILKMDQCSSKSLVVFELQDIAIQSRCKHQGVFQYLSPRWFDSYSSDQQLLDTKHTVWYYASVWALLATGVAKRLLDMLANPCTVNIIWEYIHGKNPCLKQRSDLPTFDSSHRVLLFSSAQTISKKNHYCNTRAKVDGCGIIHIKTRPRRWTNIVLCWFRGGGGDKISAAVCKRTRRSFNKCLPKFCAGSMTLIKHHVNESLSSLIEDIPDN